MSDRTLVLKAGPVQRSSLRVKAKGVDLLTPHPPLALPVTAQLQRIGGPCWESRFGADGILKKDPSGFKGKSH